MKQEGAKYYLINQCVVDPDVAMANRKVISENTVEYNGTRLFTVTYNQVLQDSAEHHQDQSIRCSDHV